jgi:hypothetical protein
MDAKEILKKIKAVFDGTVPAPAPVVTKLTTNFPVDNGDPVYVDTSDDGINDIDAGDPVYSDDAMTTPYPDGTYKVTGTDVSFTVAGGIVTTISGSLITPIGASAPPTLPLTPQFDSAVQSLQNEINELKEQLRRSKLLLEKHEKILPGLFELAEKLIELPVSEPKTLNGLQKEKFEKAKQRDDRITEMAENLKKIKTQKN